MTTTEPATGWDLVTAAQNGDTDAYGQLWARYHLNVAHYIASMVNNRATTEDLTSETFLRGFTRINTVRDQGKDVGGWFVRIARNIVYDHNRRTHNRVCEPVADITTTGVAAVLTDGPDVTVPAQRATDDAAQHLDQLIRRLSPAQQSVIRARFYDGLSIIDTATVTGLSEGAVKSTQHRATRRLAEQCRPARTAAEFVDGLAS